MTTKLCKQLTFTEMLSADVENIIAIEEKAYSHPWTSGIFHDCIKVDYDCYVLKNTKNAIVAYLVISIAANEMHILNICVHPDYQGKHLGSQLVDKCHQLAKQKQVKRCFLEVRPSNTIAIKLYTRHGYQQVGVRRKYYPSEHGREDGIVMRKYL